MTTAFTITAVGATLGLAWGLFMLWGTSKRQMPKEGIERSGYRIGMLVLHAAFGGAAGFVVALTTAFLG
jgi:hypothetical protein